MQVEWKPSDDFYPIRFLTWNSRGSMGTRETKTSFLRHLVQVDASVKSVILFNQEGGGPLPLIRALQDSCSFVAQDEKSLVQDACGLMTRATPPGAMYLVWMEPSPTLVSSSRFYGRVSNVLMVYTRCKSFKVLDVSLGVLRQLVPQQVKYNPLENALPHNQKPLSGCESTRTTVALRMMIGSEKWMVVCVHSTANKTMNDLANLLKVLIKHHLPEVDYLVIGGDYNVELEHWKAEAQRIVAHSSDVSLKSYEMLFIDPGCETFYKDTRAFGCFDYFTVLKKTEKDFLPTVGLYEGSFGSDHRAVYFDIK